MNWQRAIDYCKSQGLELPTRDQFVRLDKFLGDSNQTMTIDGKFIYGQEKTEAIPNLTPYPFWSSTLNKDVPNLAAYVFAYGADAALRISDNDVINDYKEGGSSMTRCIAH